ncbi:head GIN domain-containing protein [Mucilaginibacter sp.]|jgi:hypothetical protein|uniref:head GIN domain-containing protein n=1 Tax=Mucilaginibacter sp. TaxID=1882438 RepID=UPI002C03E49D|nr:head GIN domain-containing protein [Mucilaginibacter sp.]HTI61828.1 head GIN domain-containing protein [Mucilaginibacter sp.]
MRSIKVFLIAAVFSAGSVSAFATIKADSTVTTTRSISGFDGLHVQGPFEVYITQGTTESVKFDAPKEIVPRIVTEVHGNTLEIHNKHDNWGWGEKSWYSDKSWWRKHNVKIKVYVTVKELNNIKLSGSGGVSFKDGITANSMKLTLRGSGYIEGKLDVKKLQSAISGSGNIKLSGDAETSSVKMTGSGNFNASELVTSNSAVKVSGSGGARVNANGRVDAAISGSGGVSYTGTAKVVNSTKSGSGSISKF